RLTQSKNPALEFLKHNAPGNPLVTNDIVPRTMRRLVATGKQSDLEACLEFVAAVQDSDVRRQALDGLLTALKNQKLNPPPGWSGVLTALQQDKDAQVQKLTKKLAVHFQDLKAIQHALAVAQNTNLPGTTRVDAVRDLALTEAPEALGVLLKLVAAKDDATE